MADSLRRSARLAEGREQRPPQQTTLKRPGRLLNSKWTAKDTLSVRNATESPLLRLPAEIRTRIFHFVLGGTEIHIGHETDGIYGVTVCQKRCSQMIHLFLIRQSQESFVPSFDNRHDECLAAATKQSFDIRALGVCRQIHNEFALMPFSDNTFIVSGPGSLKTWQDSLMPIQLRAVRGVDLHFRWPHYHLTKSETRDLPALDYLGVQYEMMPTRDDFATDEDYEQHPWLISMFDWMWERLAARDTQVAMTYVLQEDLKEWGLSFMHDPHYSEEISDWLEYSILKAFHDQHPEHLHTS